MINATVIRIYWDITGDANGFLINITGNGLPTITQQLTDSSAKEFIMEYYQKGIILLMLE